VPSSVPKSLADQLEELLPQTQCTKCGYPACRPYAQAIADGEANYNQCPPGGIEGIARLAQLLGKPVIPINLLNGIERPCTGCDLCVAPCPVDCIAMVEVTPGKTGWAAWSQQQAEAARARHEFRNFRLQRDKKENDARLAAKAAAKLKAVETESASTPEAKAEQARKKAIIQAAIARARLMKEAAAPKDKT